MGYVERNLLPKERVIYSANLHWIIFLKPFYLGFLTSFVVIIFMSYTGDQQGFDPNKHLASMVFLGFFFTFILMIPVFIERITSEFAVTNRRVLMKKGWIKRSTFELLLSKMEGVQIDQSVLGRILNFGSVKVTGTGGGSDPFTNISKPMAFRKSVYSSIESLST